MKYKKQVGAVLVGSLALATGVSAYQLYPREAENEYIPNLMTEVKGEQPVEETPVGTGVTVIIEPTVTNPAPLPSSEPVVQEQSVAEPVAVGCDTPTSVMMVNMDDTRWQKLTVEHTLPWGERINILTLYKNADGRTFCLDKY